MEEPSLIAGHAQYVKGAAEVRENSFPSPPDPIVYLSFFPPYPHNPPLISFPSIDTLQATIGSVTGNQAWATSGEQDKNQAIDAMKAASENRDPNQSGFGGVEKKAGDLVGCEGMQKEGEESKKQ